MPGTMTFWGYKDKKDMRQYKGPFHHANHNPRAGMKSAHGTLSLGRSVPCFKSKKQTG